MYSEENKQFTYKPPDMSNMGRKLKMKFYVKDSGQHQFFSGQIIKYDGLTGKYGVYFPFDGEVVY